MKISLITILFVFSIALCQTNDFNVTGAGARAEGFGGAFIGLADDATAVVWNPAGLSQLERPEASIVTRLRGEVADFKDNTDPSYNASESQRNFSLNFGSLALPLKMGDTKIVIAAAFQRQLDFYDSRKQQREYTELGFPYSKYSQATIYESRGGVNTITPALGIKISPMISLGLSANIWMGSNSTVERFEDSRYIQRDQDKFDIDFSGFNIVFGGLFDLEGMKNGIPLKFGFSLKTPFTLKGTGVYDRDRTLSANSSEKFDVSQDIAMPLMFGVGTSYRIGENLTVAADYEMRNYGSKQISSTATLQGTGISGTASQDISESKQDLNEFRIGAEYLIVLDKGVIPLRGGFKTVPSVLADYIYDNASGTYIPTQNQTKGNGFAVGSGFISGSFALDITYSYSSYSQKYDPDGQIDFSFGTLGSSVIIYF